MSISDLQYLMTTPLLKSAIPKRRTNLVIVSSLCPTLSKIETIRYHIITVQGVRRDKI